MLREKLESMSSKDLREMAKNAKVKNYWNLKKSEMIDGIINATPAAQKEKIKERQPKKKNPLEEEYKDATVSSLSKELKKMEKEGITYGDRYEYVEELKKKLLKEEMMDINKNLTNKPKKKKTSKTPDAKKSVKRDDENIITLKELLPSGMNGKKARRLLRNSDIERPYNQWEWHTKDHKDIINQVKDILGAK